MAKLKVKTAQDRIREAWAAFRAERNRRLAEADWIVDQAYERGEPVPEAWAAYRQALRDLPEQLIRNPPDPFPQHPPGHQWKRVWLRIRPGWVCR